jgi:tRNA nucleotidyltransferase (CCA-adding enzyme)
MAKNNINNLLKEQIEKITPGESELRSIADKTQALTSLLKKNLAKAKISAEIFVGGSFAKNTLIKKAKYDVDIFVRFDIKYKDKISEILAKAVPKNAVRIHGSRDYFSLKNSGENVEFEIIPTIKITKPENAENITDLSYFHVKYLAGKTKKDKKLVNEIRLAKAFAYYQNCYGAESYINGFSGYAVELLVVNYRGFLNFIKAISKADITNKIILDPERLFKKKSDIGRELNEAKMNSPIILIDPTFKERNALAALSNETFLRFQKASRDFLKSPSANFFEFIDEEKLMKSKYKNLIELRVSTDKQAGDIAGTKLKKFYGFFLKEVQRFFDIEKSGFFYDENINKARFLLAAKEKKNIEFSGPPIIMREALAKFKRQHKKIIVKKGQAFAYEKAISFDKFLNSFLNSKSKVINEMDVTDIEKI